jgi:glyoxylase-like metal-dependent hydrolase (beta-lactamase superfamily II)
MATTEQPQTTSITFHPHGDPIVTQLDDHLWMIDLQFLGKPNILSAYLFAGQDRLALVETGPVTTLPALRAGVESVGYALTELTDVYLTHIHLDHAGASGYLVQEAPNATIHVHSSGVPHLIDPARLWRSATHVYGDRMEMLWGGAAGIAENRLQPLEDGQTVRAGDADLLVVHTPGHAGNHVVYWHEPSRTQFTGDAAGARVPETGFVCPTLAPPEVDLPLWQASLDRMAELGPRRLILTHFGPFTDAAAHLARMSENLERWRELAIAAMRQGAGQDELTTIFHNEMVAGLAAGETADEAAVETLELAMPSYMSAMGIERYVTKHELL